MYTVLSLNGSPIARGYVNVGRATRFSESVARVAIGFFTIFSFICAFVEGTYTGGATSQLCVT